MAVDNDAKALALGEGWLGAAQGVHNYLAMVVSTGIGGGIVLDGQLLDGTWGNAGHIGHVVVEPDGRACVCGGQGCLEAEASGLSIETVTGRPASEASAAVRRRAGMLIGRAVASVANLLDLELAVVAGSVALGFAARRSSMPPRRRSNYGRDSTSRNRPVSSRPAWVPTARWSGAAGRGPPGAGLPPRRAGSGP